MSFTKDMDQISLKYIRVLLEVIKGPVTRGLAKKAIDHRES